MQIGRDRLDRQALLRAGLLVLLPGQCEQDRGGLTGSLHRSLCHGVAPFPRRPCTCVYPFGPFALVDRSQPFQFAAQRVGARRDRCRAAIAFVEEQAAAVPRFRRGRHDRGELSADELALLFGAGQDRGDPIDPGVRTDELVAVHLDGIVTCPSALGQRRRGDLHLLDKTVVGRSERAVGPFQQCQVMA